MFSSVVAYLVVDISDVLAAVLVDEVERVAGEDDLLARPEAALHEEGVGVPYQTNVHRSAHVFLQSSSISCIHRSNVSMSHPPHSSRLLRVWWVGFDVRVTSQMRSLLRFSYWLDILACGLDVTC